MYLAFVLFRLLKRTLTAACRQNVVVGFNQQVGNELQDIWVIVHDENGPLIVLGADQMFHSYRHNPGDAAVAASRRSAIRFCSVRRLIPSIWAASFRLPRTCSSVSLM